jgi:hypothetical protein
MYGKGNTLCHDPPDLASVAYLDTQRFNALYKAEEGLVGHGRPTQLECYPKLR